MADEIASVEESKIKKFFRKLNFKEHKGILTILLVSFSILFILIAFVAVKNQLGYKSRASVNLCDYITCNVEDTKDCLTSSEKLACCDIIDIDEGECKENINPMDSDICSTIKCSLKKDEASCTSVKSANISCCRWYPKLEKKCNKRKNANYTCQSISSENCETGLISQQYCQLSKYGCTDKNINEEENKEEGKENNSNDSNCTNPPKNGECQQPNPGTAIEVGAPCKVNEVEGKYEQGLCEGGSDRRCCVPSSNPNPPPAINPCLELGANKSVCEKNIKCIWVEPLYPESDLKCRLKCGQINSRPNPQSDCNNRSKDCEWKNNQCINKLLECDEVENQEKCEAYNICFWSPDGRCYKKCDLRSSSEGCNRSPSCVWNNQNKCITTCPHISDVNACKQKQECNWDGNQKKCNYKKNMLCLDISNENLCNRSWPSYNSQDCKWHKDKCYPGCSTYRSLSACNFVSQIQGCKWVGTPTSGKCEDK